MFSLLDYDDHERVLIAHDRETGLRAIVALHNTALGPAFGGCRMWPYEDDHAALTDVLRLSRGMTYKAAICGLPYGGGKSVIIGDPARDKTPDLLRAMGRLVESLDGTYIIADDVGTSLDDLAEMRTETSHTAAATAEAQAPLAVTAYGLLTAIEAAVEVVLGRTDLADTHVAVQGLGHVGEPLCRYLYERGARLTVADIAQDRTEAAARNFGSAVVDSEDIYDVEADVFAPCALGAVLNETTIRRLGAKVVCGGANNQLKSLDLDATLAARGIIYVPDYLANAGGVIDFHQERIDGSPEAVLAAVARIGEIAKEVLLDAKTSGKTPLVVADQRVRQRLGL